MKTIATTKIEAVENPNNPRLWRSIENGASGALAKAAQFKEYEKEHAIMKRHVLLTSRTRVWLAVRQVLLPVGQTAQAQGKIQGRCSPDCVPGGRANGRLDSEHGRCIPRCSGRSQQRQQPTAARQKGRREINWDGGNPPVDNTTPTPVTPFNVFLNTRGAQFTTPGIGLTQAPPSGGPEGGLEVLFNNPTYGATFSTFSGRACSLR